MFIYNDIKLFCAICYNHLANVTEKIIKFKRFGITPERKNTKQNQGIKKGLIVGFHSMLILVQNHLHL